MVKLPVVKPRKLLQILQKEGFFIHHQKGSHIVLKSKTDSAKRVTLPMHHRDLKRKTLISILKQAGLNKDILQNNKSLPSILQTAIEEMSRKLRDPLMFDLPPFKSSDFIP